MRGVACGFGLCLALMVSEALAEGMTVSPRPMPRPETPAAVAADAPAAAAPVLRPRARPDGLAAAAVVADNSAPQLQTVIRPRPRPEGLAPAAPPEQTAPVDLAALAPPPDMPRPRPRPRDLQQVAEDAPRQRGGGLFGGLFGGGGSSRDKPKPQSSGQGYVCGDPDIIGVDLAPIAAETKGCGLDAPVRVTSIDGIRLNPAPTFGCDTATALKRWINEGARPSFKRDLVELHIAASYICRPRNNVRGAKISEHGRGKAVDIGAFVFDDGTVMTVARDYGKQIRKAHRAACGIFGTTLGPGSDGYHEDHLHFDTASYRGGPYCR